MFEAVNPVALLLGNLFGGFCLGIALFFALLYLLTYFFSSVDTVAVAIVGGMIIFLLAIFGFDSYMNSLIHSEVSGIQGAANKFLEFISSALFVGGAVAGFGGAYKLNS